jgi:biopolymer transport protein ExbD
VNNDPVNFEDLEKKLNTQVKDIANTTVVIRCDNTVPVQQLVNVLQIGNKLKIKMILATKAPNA